jgi:predicted RNA-binding protein YlxR (DUF448 family)
MKFHHLQSKGLVGVIDFESKQYGRGIMLYNNNQGHDKNRDKVGRIQKHKGQGVLYTRNQQ